MKPFYLLPVFFGMSIASAQIDGGFSYSLSLPQHEMQQNIRPIHGMNLIAISPVKKISKLSWGLEIGFGQYSFFGKDQDIRFPDGTGINTKVTYSSNVAHAGI